jgi:hypothetical protein
MDMISTKSLEGRILFPIEVGFSSHDVTETTTSVKRVRVRILKK